MSDCILTLFSEHHRLGRNELGEIMVEQLRIDLRVYPHILVLHNMYRIRRRGANQPIEQRPIRPGWGQAE